MTNNDMKSELEAKKAEFLKSLEEQGMVFGETIIGLLGIAYDQAFIDGSDFILKTVHSALPK